MSPELSLLNNQHLTPISENGHQPHCNTISVFLDVADRIVVVKGNTEAVIGSTPKEIIGKNFLELVHQDDREKWTASLKALSLGAASVTVQSRFFCSNKDEVQLQWTAHYDDTLKCICCTTDAADNEMSSTSFERIYKAYKLAQVGWWEWDAVKDVLHVSNELYEIYGLNKTLYPQFSTEIYLSLVHPDDAGIVQAAMKESLRVTYNLYTHRLIQPGGKIIHLAQHVQTQFDSEGNVVSMHGTAKDISAQKQWELTLEESEQKCRDILESITDGFFAMDYNWNVLYFNKAAEELTGLKEAAVLGKHFWTLFPTAKNLPVHDLYHKVIKENKPVYFEMYSQLFADWFGVSVYPFRLGLSVSFHSITESKNKEKALSLSNERYKLLSKASSDAIWDWDLLTGTIYWSEGFEALFGHKLPNSTSQHTYWINQIHPDDRERVFTSIDKVIKGRELFWRDEYRFQKKDGTHAFVSDRGYIIRDEAGKAVRMVGAMQDVTAQKEAEIANRISEDRFKLLFSRSPKPKWMFEAETLRIVEVNEAACRLYGYSKEEFLRLHINNLKVKEDLPELAILISKKLSAYHNVVRHVKKDGEIFYIDIHTEAIELPNGKHFIVAGDDQTERLELQQQLIRDKVAAQRKMAQAVINTQERERSEIGRELHDNVNQLLATTKLYIENIQYYPDQKDAFIEKGIALLQKSINEIRFLSKQLVTPVMKDMGFSATIEEMIEHFRSLQLFNIDVKYDFFEDKLDQELKLTIYRIIQEQLTNVVKYAKASKVRIAIIQDAGKLKVIIKDNGLGFDTAKVSGGIGLKNIKNRAEIYNGAVNIKSEINAGCVVEVLFPLA